MHLLLAAILAVHVFDVFAETVVPLWYYRVRTRRHMRE
jgi:hypothetical protein